MLIIGTLARDLNSTLLAIELRRILRLRVLKAFNTILLDSPFKPGELFGHIFLADEAKSVIIFSEGPSSDS